MTHFMQLLMHDSLSLCIRACYRTQVFNMVPNAHSKLIVRWAAHEILFVL